VGRNRSVVAAMRASKTVPIVMTVSTEPVASGLVVSLNRPGGNVTGLAADVTPDTWGLRLQLLREVNPGVKWRSTAVLCLMATILLVRIAAQRNMSAK